MSGGIPQSLEQNWLPIAVGAGGAALLGAGRAGSPASQLGMNLVQPILGYYVNQAATADERARRQKIEDELLQRQRDMDTRSGAMSQADLLLKSGRFDVGTSETPGARNVDIAGQKFYFSPKPQTGVEPWAMMAENAWGPTAGEQIRKLGASVPPEQLSTLMQPAFSALSVGQQRQQEQGLGDMVKALGRPSGEEFPGGVQTLRPPAFSPEETQFYGAALKTPAGQQHLLSTIGERLAAQDPRFGSAFQTPQAGPGEQMTRTFTQESGKRPRQTTQISPVPYTERADQAAIQLRKDQATRLSVSPEYAKVIATLEPAAQLVAKNALQDAIATGSPDSLSSVNNILLAQTNPRALGLQELEAAYFQKNPKAFGDYMRTRTEGKDKESFYLKQIANVGQRKQYLQHTYDAQGKATLNPALAGMEQEEATYWRRLAESDPQHYAVEAFTHLAQLLRWDRATFDKEVKDFASRYNLPLTSGAR